jgi:hypothetical protein
MRVTMATLFAMKMPCRFLPFNSILALPTRFESSVSMVSVAYCANSFMESGPTSRVVEELFVGPEFQPPSPSDAKTEDKGSK